MLLVFAEFREDGQRQHFAGGAFGFREISLFVPEGFEGFLKMQRDGVVDLRSDFAFGQESAEVVSARGADDVLVPDVAASRNLVRQNDAVVWIRTSFC